jgi:hypothetical protein
MLMGDGVAAFDGYLNDKERCIYLRRDRGG